MLNITDITRASGVTRWQIVPTIRKQNLAEHSFMVAVISKFLVENVMRKECSADIFNYALFHDLSELVTGDICTPVKERIRAKVGDIFQSIEEEIDHRIPEYRGKLNGAEILLIKIADLLDAVRFLREEGYTNHASVVLAKIEDRIKNLILLGQKIHSGYDWSSAEKLFEIIGRDQVTTMNFEYGGWDNGT